MRLLEGIIYIIYTVPSHSCISNQGHSGRLVRALELHVRDSLTGFGHYKVTSTLEKAFNQSTWEGVCYQTCNAQEGGVSEHMVWG